MRVNIPKHLATQDLLDEAFDIPDTAAGSRTQDWWKRASAPARFLLLKTASTIEGPNRVLDAKDALDRAGWDLAKLGADKKPETTRWKEGPAGHIDVETYDEEDEDEDELDEVDADEFDEDYA